MMNILNGGAHADTNVDVQEFMIAPVGAATFSEALRWGAEVYHALKAVLKKRGLSTGVGDEGGFAPDLPTNRAALDLIVEAIGEAGLHRRAATSRSRSTSPRPSSTPTARTRFEGAGPQCGRCRLVLRGARRRVPDRVDRGPAVGGRLGRLGGAHREPRRRRCSSSATTCSSRTRARLARGIDAATANALLVKVNQIGTLSETLDAVDLAHRSGYRCMMSHRSGETEDTTIADLAVATNCGQIKTGAPARSERVAKYNQLLRIEEELGDAARYAGATAFPRAPRG